MVDVDADGFVKIVGRVKRFRQRWPARWCRWEAVEARRRRLAGASPCASTQPDASRGETILLFSTDPQLTRDRLQTAARDGGWPEIAVPRRIIRSTPCPARHRQDRLRHPQTDG